VRRPGSSGRRGSKITVGGYVTVEMPRLRRVDCSSPGIARRRRGLGFSYVDEYGRVIRDPGELERLRALVIPPAWRDVWICADANGHLQAVGTDEAGRRQYLYHPAWRARQDQRKFDQMRAFARALPELRVHVAEKLAGTGLSRDRVLACSVRLLDRGFFRIGGEAYAEENGSFGLATLQRRHVKLEAGDTLVFEYLGKAGKHREQAIVDPLAYRVAAELTRRRSGGDELLAYRNGRGWVDVRSTDINAFIKGLMGDEFSAKDFRTWHGTVLAAVALAVSTRPASTSGRKRAIARAVQEVSHYLGNTPAVCRASYIDSRVIDRYQEGRTIARALEQLAWPSEQDAPATQGPVEEAVLNLLDR
jgi:DNA topoisomerase IB